MQNRCGRPPSKNLVKSLPLAVSGQRLFTPAMAWRRRPSSLQVAINNKHRSPPVHQQSQTIYLSVVGSPTTTPKWRLLIRNPLPLVPKARQERCGCGETASPRVIGMRPSPPKKPLRRPSITTKNLSCAPVISALSRQGNCSSLVD